MSGIPPALTPTPPGARCASSPGHIYLIGFMGSGKSTIGRLVADHLSMPLLDLDVLIEMHRGSTIPTIFAEDGEDAFRALETEALASVLAAEPSVVACGGGVVLAPRNVELLKSSGCVVYLMVSVGEALARIENIEGRPLLASGGPEAATVLLAAREPLYRAAADVLIDTDHKSVEAVATEVEQAVRTRAGRA